MVSDYFITYLRDFADLILINAVLIMDFAQFLGYNFRVITALSFLIWQGSRDWDTSSGNPSVSEVVLVNSGHFLVSETNHFTYHSVLPLPCEACVCPHCTEREEVKAQKDQCQGWDLNPILMFSQAPTLSLCLLPSEGSLTDSGFLVPLPCEAGCRQIQDLEIPSVEVDPCGDAQAAAEGAVLGLYEYDDLKQKRKVVVSAKLHGR